MFEIRTNPQIRLNQGLFEAILNCDLTAVKNRIEEGADPNTMRTDIHVLLKAASQESWEICKFLLDKNSSPNCPNDFGWAPIHEFAKHGHLELIEKAKDLGALMNRFDKAGRNPALIAAEFNQLEALKSLSEKSVSINVEAKSGRTPIHWAVEHENAEMIDWLLKLGLNPAQEDKEKKSAISIAEEKGNLEIKSLLEKFVIEKDLKAALNEQQKERGEISEVKSSETREEIIKNTVTGGTNADSGKRRILKA